MRLRRKSSRRLRNRRSRPRCLRKRDRLIAPPYFVLVPRGAGALAADIDAFFHFLGQIRGCTSPLLRIDMSRVKRLVADAALLFKAELSRLIEVRKVQVTSIPPNSERSKQVLKQTGLDQLLNAKIDCAPNREDVVHWRIAQGPRTIVDPSVLVDIMADIESVTGMESHPIYQGIIESMANCVEHAYKPHAEVTRSMPDNPGWWVFQQVRDRVLYVVVCDLGIGVRRSLPLTLAGEHGLYKKLMHLVRRTKGDDNRALLAAMEYGRTSTGEKQRGKGMRNAHKVVDDLGRGSFWAMSDRGCYVYNKELPEHSGSQRTVRLRHSIEGTILGWSLPLEVLAEISS